MMNDALPAPAEAPKVAVIELSVAISGVGPVKLYMSRRERRSRPS